MDPGVKGSSPFTHPPLRAFHPRVVAVTGAGPVGLLAALLGFILLGEIFMPEVMQVIAPGFSEEPGKFDLAVDLARITFPYLLFIALVALQGGVLLVSAVVILVNVIVDLVYGAIDPRIRHGR